jgi:RES domain-containing protein
VTTAWRLVKTRYADTAFSGLGARLAGGRWNHPGIAVVYVSNTLALAVLELFVHLDRRSRAALRLVAIPVGIPDELVSGRPDLPRGWRAEPPPTSTKDLGTAWLRSGGSCALRVPSAIVPVEDNLMLDPAHPDFSKIDIGSPEPFSLDPRLWK